MNATKFSDMEYRRVDTEALRAEYAALTEKVGSADGVGAVSAAIERHEKLTAEYSTALSLAYIRHTIDTKNEYWAAENDFCDEAMPVVDDIQLGFLKALLASPFRPELEKKYGGLAFRNIEMQLKCFSPEIIPELQEENRLMTEYNKLVAAAEIDFDGKKLNLAQLDVYRESPDREVRRAACEANGRFYLSIGDKLDELYDKLVKTRTAIAKKLGYKTFTEVAYLRRTRNCYGPAEVKTFRGQVEKNVVPVVTLLKKLQAKRIGVDKLKFWDDPFGYPEGNPKPHGTSDELLAAGRRMYTEMSPETAEFIDFMYESELLDVLSKPGKAVGGYSTDIPVYRAPFIFSNFNGTSGDVDVLTHEAGHAFASYMNRDPQLLETALPTIEACEVHSMSMEFIAWRWLELFYGDEAKRAKFRHLEDALVFLPYGCMVDEFQNTVYDEPELTPAERHKAWEALEARYRPYLDRSDVPFYEDGRGWQRQHHIYDNPFYYIDYCLAQTVALMFWSATQRDFGDAWERYLKFVKRGGLDTFTELCKAAGFPTPFEKGSLEDAVGTAGEWIRANE